MSLSSRVRRRRRGKRSKRWPLMAGVLLACLVSYGVYSRIGTPSSRSSETNVDDSEIVRSNNDLVVSKNGAGALSDHLDGRRSPEMRQPEVSHDTLDVEFKFYYLPASPSNSVIERDYGAALSADEPYHLTVSASEPCHLTVLQRRSSGKLVQLFPNRKYSSLENPIPRGTLRLPENEDWIYLDEIPGTETIYLVASKWPQTVLEDVLADQSHRLSAEVQAYLSRQAKAAIESPGLVYSEYQFEHKQ